MKREPDDLERFVDAQNTDGIFEKAVRELRAGRKESHWIWYVFPQLRGLGRSGAADYFGIADRAEAIAYLNHDVLGPRLRRCTQLLIQSGVCKVRLLMRSEGDVTKLKSSMTLFAAVTEDNSDFREVLRKYYEGGRDLDTLRMLGPPPVPSESVTPAPRRRSFWELLRRSQSGK